MSTTITLGHIDRPSAPPAPQQAAPWNGATLQAKAFKRAGNSVAVSLWLAYSHRIMRFFP
jgi:hypothetical protein